MLLSQVKTHPHTCKADCALRNRMITCKHLIWAQYTHRLLQHQVIHLVLLLHVLIKLILFCSYVNSLINTLVLFIETCFPDWPSWLPLNKRAKVALYCSPDYQTSFESIDLSVQEKNFSIDFQDGGHLGFPIRIILATFDLQVTLILPMKFRVNWPFGSG